jgi:hypothetical protein
MNAFLGKFQFGSVRPFRILFGSQLPTPFPKVVFYRVFWYIFFWRSLDRVDRLDRLDREAGFSIGSIEKLASRSARSRGF